MAHKKDFPFNQIAFTSSLIEAILEVQNENENWKYFDLTSDSPVSFKLTDSKDKSDFFFSVSAFDRDYNTYFLVKSSPYGPHKLGQKEQHLDHRKTFEGFKSWLSLLKKYDKVNDYSNPYFNQRVDEWIQYFDLVDEKAHEGLSNDQILLLNESLNQWQEIIAQELSSEGEELSQEAKLLQDSLPTISKRKFVRNLGKFLVKIMRKSPDLLLKLLKFTGKEALKELIQHGTGSLLNLG